MAMIPASADIYLGLFLLFVAADGSRTGIWFPWAPVYIYVLVTE